MAKPMRDPLPWEARTGCATCKARPGERCHTLNYRYLTPRERKHGFSGRPTAPHKARYLLWCHLWCRRTCEVTSP